MIRQGKIRYIGCSNYSGWHLMKSLAAADARGRSRFVAHQAYYSLVGRDYEWELMPLAIDQGVGAVVWSPLGWGRLTGRIRRGQPLPEGSRNTHASAAAGGPQIPEDYLYDVIEAIEGVAAEVERTVPQVALNWLLQRPTVSTIILGCRNEAQLLDNLGCLGWTLTPEQMGRLNAASERPRPYPYWHQDGFSRNPGPV
jgi:aryl-alcohol dehydrogenase-like predicted oxidoreductase